MKAIRGIGLVWVLLLLAGLLGCQGNKVEPTPGEVAVRSTTGAAPSTRPPQPPPAGALIVDNNDPGFSVEAGDWGTCRGSECSGTPYGEDFRFADPTCADCRARFDLNVPHAGNYTVWTWWPWGEDRATDTSFTIRYGGESLTVAVDQRNSGDDWYYLLELPFEAGPVSVVVGSTSSGYANADAVALTTAGSGPPGQGSIEPPTAAGPVVQYFYSEPASAGCHYLHWDVSEADAVYLDEVEVDNPGSAEVCPEGATVYTLRAENAAGTVVESLRVDAGGEPAAGLPVIEYFYAEEGPLDNCFTLYWEVSEAEGVSLDDGSVDNPGQSQVCPDGTEVYTLRAENDAGTVEQSVSLTAEASAPPTAAPLPPASGAIVIDHTCTDLSRIPAEWLERAKQLALHYAHTSHGSQIVTGVEWLEWQDPRYNVAVRYCGDDAGLPGEAGALAICDGNPPGGDYIEPGDYWASSDGLRRTRAVAATGLFNFSMWSWCGQQSDNDRGTVQQYLEALDQLEREYPNMRFIYMTGHTDGGGDTLARNNDMVRQYAREHGKILFDFADIESYDPDGTHYPYTDDSCPWCYDWCDSHPQDCRNLDQIDDCAHTHPLLCKLKAQAFWWLMARLAGWDGR